MGIIIVIIALISFFSILVYNRFQKSILDYENKIPKLYSTHKISTELNYSFIPDYTRFKDSYLNKKITEILNRQKLYLEQCLPFFVYTNTANKISLYFKPFQEIAALEEITSYWSQGYRDKRIAHLACCYTAQKGKENWQSTVQEILEGNNLDFPEKELLRFYFQNILQKNKTILLKDLIEEDINSVKEVFAYQFSIEIHNNLEKWTRKEYSTKLQSLLTKSQIWKTEKSFLQSFQEVFLNKADSLLSFIIVYHNPNLFIDNWKKILYKQAFHYGKYTRLSFLKIHQPNLYSMLTYPNPFTLEANDFPYFSKFLQQQNFGVFHLFLHIFQSDPNHPLLKQIELNYSESIHNPEIHTNYLCSEQSPLFIKWIYYLYLGYRQKWKEVLTQYPSLKEFQKNIFSKLYYVRALYNSDQRVQAWNILVEMLKEDSKNIVILNEAVICAIKLKRFTDVEKLFNRMKTLYPKHPLTLRNLNFFKNQLLIAS